MDTINYLQAEKLYTTAPVKSYLFDDINMAVPEGVRCADTGKNQVYLFPMTKGKFNSFLRYSEKAPKATAEKVVGYFAVYTEPSLHRYVCEELVGDEDVCSYYLAHGDSNAKSLFICGDWASSLAIAKSAKSDEAVLFYSGDLSKLDLPQSMKQLRDVYICLTYQNGSHPSRPQAVGFSNVYSGSLRIRLVELQPIRDAEEVNPYFMIKAGEHTKLASLVQSAPIQRSVNSSRWNSTEEYLVTNEGIQQKDSNGKYQPTVMKKPLTVTGIDQRYGTLICETLTIQGSRIQFPLTGVALGLSSLTNIADPRFSKQSARLLSLGLFTAPNLAEYQTFLSSFSMNCDYVAPTTEASIPFDQVWFDSITEQSRGVKVIA